MAITLKTPEEIEKMRVAGRLAAEVLKMIAPHVQPGITTGELDRLCHDYIVNEQQAVATNLITDFQTGAGTASVAEVMVAMQKASLSFTAMTQVRNKLVEAYQEIMNMPI